MKVEEGRSVTGKRWKKEKGVRLGWVGLGKVRSGKVNYHRGKRAWR